MRCRESAREKTDLVKWCDDTDMPIGIFSIIIIIIFFYFFYFFLFFFLFFFIFFIIIIIIFLNIFLFIFFQLCVQCIHVLFEVEFMASMSTALLDVSVLVMATIVGVPCGLLVTLR